MKLQRLLSLTRQAVDDYGLIDNGDILAVGISGGKDSLTLLYALEHLRKDLCEQLSVPYQVVSTDIGKIVFEQRRETSPCSLCAKLRKGALNKAALEAGCSKVAYGHHKNDIVETMLLSLLYEGRFYSFSPKTCLDRTKLTVIRPLLYVDEADVKGFCSKYQLPVCKNPCPADGVTRREYVKQLTKTLEHDNPGVRQRLFHAVISGNIPGWPQKESHPLGI